MDPHYPIRILIVEDDLDDFLIVSGLLQDIPDNHFRIDQCSEFATALPQLWGNNFDIYFVDYFLGAKTGLDLLEEASKGGFEGPFVLLTGLSNREIDMRAMRMGAIDFLVKSELNSEKLERCIRYALERSSSTRALKANERKFRSIFEKSGDAIFLLDEELYFQDVNPATCSLFKCDKEELLRFPLYEFLSDKSIVPRLTSQWKNYGKVEDMELDFVTREQERKHCMVSLAREQDIDGIVYAQGIIHDITHLRRIERANLQIEKLQSYAGLARILAHEVRNPLTNINLAVDQLQAGMDLGEGSQCLSIISRNSHRIEALIRQLLDSARSREILLERHSLQTILEKCIYNAMDRIILKRIRLEKQFPDGPAAIMCDPDKLGIAFLNIIINATEAMNRDDGHLQVAITDETRHYQVVIADNGNGISGENLARIFEPHFSSKSSGFGLGLSTTLNILQAHQAAIDVQSQEHKGTTFVVTFDKAAENGN
jgi:PAS domain S-box-containing protein